MYKPDSPPILVIIGHSIHNLILSQSTVTYVTACVDIVTIT